MRSHSPVGSLARLLRTLVGAAACSVAAFGVAAGQARAADPPAAAATDANAKDAAPVAKPDDKAKDDKPKDDKPKDDKPKDDAAAAAQPGTEPALAFERFTLDNGLDVILHQDARLPVACVDVWYHVGAFHEDAGRTGFAHLFEHLMFQGTPHVPGDSHFKLLEQAGASFTNGTTDFDRTNYFEVVPKNELELALWLESDRMGWLMQGVDQAKLDEQRKVVKNERRQSVENAPYGLADEKLWQAMFPPAHPYWGYVIGSMADLDRASLADVRAFYDAYYAPSNATIVIAGDIDKDQAKALVRKYFDTLPKWPKPASKSVAAPALTKEIRVDAVDAVAQLPRVQVQYFTPPMFAAGAADLEVLAGVLGGGPASRLHQALVVDSQLAQEVHVVNQPWANTSVFAITVTLAPGKDPEMVLKSIQAQLALLLDLPPTAEEVERVVNTVETRRVLDLQLVLNRAELLQTYTHFAGDPNFFAKDAARYAAVTPETVLLAATKYLPEDKRAILVVTPQPPPASPAVADPKEPK